MGVPNYTEAEALRLMQQGEEAGLKALFQAYYRPLVYFACQLTGDPPFAEEMASEAFVKLWAAKEELQAQGSVKAWLYTTVRHGCIDQLRRAQRLRVGAAGLEADPPSPTPVLERMIAAETVHRVVQMLEALPPKCREVFRLYFLQGLSYAEIAARLGTTERTVRNQKGRAVQLLKERMRG